MTAIDERPTAAAATPEFEALAARQERRRGALLALPAFVYLFIFFETSISGAYSSIERITHEQW